MYQLRPRGFHLPPVIKNLLIINGLVWLVEITLLARFNYDLGNLFALHYWQSDMFRPWQFVTHIFMHSPGNFAHIFMNMLTLWMFGTALEDRWGSKRFLLFYLICGLGAALCYMGWLTYDNMKLANEAQAFFADPSVGNFSVIDNRFHLGEGMYGMDGLKYAIGQGNDGAIDMAKGLIARLLDQYRNASMMGASGAVYGILFAFGYMYPNEYVYLNFLIPVKAKYVVGFLIAVELWSQIQNSAGDNVAHIAHLGGVVFSYLLLRNWNRKIF
ncbi:MAG: rhomboid family intramembrane serine protease [Chitinophaga sp.]|uniref:rhomboid family intramembrane serine protease n=1 Tax=Chitinophaga sp. TaxID=1869181 RepID=UPI0025C62BC0|nr:rhomboid family intramembrane serine protease [Chitinophaga sp.]MBV8254562.1 rhomboid family intramembrane serine protease [Chitinophaga sp.]